MTNARLLVFFNALFEALSKAVFFSAELKSKSQSVQEEVTFLEKSMASKATANIIAGQREKVDNSISVLLSMIELEVNKSNLPEREKAELLTGLGLKPRDKRRNLQRQFRVQAGEKKGSARLSARGSAVVHEWWYSTDLENYSNTVALDATTVANTEVTGLTRGTYAFFHKVKRKNMPTEIEGPVLFVVA